MNNERLVKGIYKWKSLFTRNAFRPKYRWEDDFTKDLKLLKIKKPKKCNQNREKWRRTVGKAKTFKDRSFRALRIR
jgi:hypothetical protein